MESAANTQPVLLAYDGSVNAKEAIARAAQLFPGRPAVVLNTWEPLSAVASVPPVPGLAGVLRKGLEEMDAVGEKASAQLAEEGAGLARDAGIATEPATTRSDGKAWRGIVAYAQECDAAVIVIGRRGASPLEQAFLGSVSAGVVRHSARPVLVVPDADRG